MFFKLIQQKIISNFLCGVAIHLSSIYWALNVPGAAEAKPSKILLRAQNYLQQEHPLQRDKGSKRPHNSKTVSIWPLAFYCTK